MLLKKELIERFFKGSKNIPRLWLVGMEGLSILPVLHYRALLHHVQAPVYWEAGEAQQAFRWNNYLNRFHYRHLDLMDVLAGYQIELLLL